MLTKKEVYDILWGIQLIFLLGWVSRAVYLSPEKVVEITLFGLGVFVVTWFYHALGLAILIVVEERDTNAKEQPECKTETISQES